MRSAPAALVCLVLLGCAFVFGLRPESQALWLALGVVALVLEMFSLQLPYFGALSSAHIVYLAAALLPKVGPAAAALLTVAGIGLRALLRGREDFDDSLAEAVADALPILAATALVAVLPSSLPFTARALIAVLIYLPLAHFVPRALVGELSEIEFASWCQLTDLLRPHRCAIAFLAPVTTLLMLQHPGAAAWLLLVLPVVYSAGENRMAEFVLEQRARSLRGEEDAVAALEKTRGELAQTHQDLQAKLDERLLLEELSKAFATSPSLEQTMDVAIGIGAQVIECDSFVFFLPGESGLEPVRFRSPHAQRLADHALLNVKEPLVEKCWQEGRLLIGGRDAAAGARLCEGEVSSVALPLHGQGVLYVGRQKSEPFPRKQLYLLALLGDHVSPAIVSARRYHRLQEALRLHAAAHSNLKRWNERLHVMLEGFVEMASTLSLEAICEQLQCLLERLIPQQEAGIVLLGSLEQPLEQRSWPDKDWDQTALLELAEVVQGNGRPLLLDDLGQSRFRAARADHLSLLAFPLSHAARPLGVVLLTAKASGAFSREHQDMLSVASVHTAALGSNTQLYQQVVEAHRQLEESQAQLAQSSKMAAVGQLAAGVAHEINSPLGAILLQVQSALRNLKKGKPDKATEKLGVAQEAARSAREIIEKLLFYSRQAPSERKPVALDKVIHDTLDLMRSQVEQNGVTIVLELGEVAPMPGNHNQLQQVVTNLLLNARDACLDEGAFGKAITLRTRQENNENVLEVEDQGCGIDEQARTKVFDPFFTTKEVGQGTGLGLSVTHQLLEEHGAEISFDSEVGRGTCFRVRFGLG